jgi:hypothetical protein
MPLSQHAKICRGCDQELPLSAFASRSERNGKPKSRCRECMRAYSRERKAARSTEAVERDRAAGRAWHRKNAERTRANRRRYYAENREAILEHRRSPEYRAIATRARYKRLYSLTDAELDRLLALKECEICGAEGKLQLDHDHVTGRARGMLCPACNTWVAHIEHRGHLAAHAEAYLDRSGTVRS